MNAEIVERADAQVLGITARINPMQANYGGLWGQHFGPAAFQCTTATIGPTWGRIYGQVAGCVHRGDEHFAWRARTLCTSRARYRYPLCLECFMMRGI